jgi:hypothetical protein
MRPRGACRAGSGLGLCLIPALLVAGGCVPYASGSPDGYMPFVAFGASFAGFESWASNTTDGAFNDGSVHVSGIRTVYINQLPPPGATEFSIGTLIVKVAQADQKIFARAKRGFGYNGYGAVDWEWFELQETSQHDVTIIWRGVGPPSGEMYGGDPTGGCNACHAVAVHNDYVLSPWLDLAGGAPADAEGPADAAQD